MRHVAKYEGEERCLRGFGRATEGEVLLWKFSLRWEDNIKVALKEQVSRTWAAVIWLNMGTSDELL